MVLLVIWYACYINVGYCCFCVLFGYFFVDCWICTLVLRVCICVVLVFWCLLFTLVWLGCVTGTNVLLLGLGICVVLPRCFCLLYCGFDTRNCWVCWVCELLLVCWLGYLCCFVVLFLLCLGFIVLIALCSLLRLWLIIVVSRFVGWCCFYLGLFSYGVLMLVWFGIVFVYAICFGYFILVLMLFGDILLFVCICLVFCWWFDYLCFSFDCYLAMFLICKLCCVCGVGCVSYFCGLLCLLTLTLGVLFVLWLCLLWLFCLFRFILF